jgi:hypothetical protein
MMTWTKACESVVRGHPGVVAAYRSPRGDLALLLTHTLVPLVEERIAWLTETRRVAHAAIVALRAIGVWDPIIVVQWRSSRDAERILTRWTLCYDGDPGRREQLADIARARVDDDVMAARSRPPEPRVPVRTRFIDWYRDMAPSWLAATPHARRRLLLCTHRWVVERVLAPLSRGEAAYVGDLRRGGRLEWMLVRAIRPDEVPAWTSWIDLVRGDLERALSWPSGRRNDAWIRWLFLIPYSIPLRAPCRSDVAESSPA